MVNKPLIRPYFFGWLAINFVAWVKKHLSIQNLTKIATSNVRQILINNPSAKESLAFYKGKGFPQYYNQYSSFQPPNHGSTGWLRSSIESLQSS